MLPPVPDTVCAEIWAWLSKLRVLEEIDNNPAVPSPWLLTLALELSLKVNCWVLTVKLPALPLPVASDSRVLPAWSWIKSVELIVTSPAKPSIVEALIWLCWFNRRDSKFLNWILPPVPDSVSAEIFPWFSILTLKASTNKSPALLFPLLLTVTCARSRIFNWGALILIVPAPPASLVLTDIPELVPASAAFAVITGENRETCRL